MDPKYGEISRAMRNRGVEIALVEKSLQDSCTSQGASQLDQKPLQDLRTSQGASVIDQNSLQDLSLSKGVVEKCAQDIVEKPLSTSPVATNIDLREQLTALGVEDYETQCRLVQIHLTMSEQCAATYDTSHLLRAAHLFSQYRQQKFDSHEAMRIACREIYVKCMLWCPSQYATISTTLNEMLADSEPTDKQPVCSVLPIRTRDYLYDSTFSRVRHQTWLLYCYIQQYIQHFSPVVSICDVLPIQPGTLYASIPNGTSHAGIPVSEINFLDAFRYLVMVAYDYASLADLEMRRAYILRLVEQIRTARAKMKTITDHKIVSETSSSETCFLSKKKKKRKSNAQKSQSESCDNAPSCDSTISDSTLIDKVDALVDQLTVILNIVHNVSESQYETMFQSELHRPFDVRRTMLKANTNGAMNNKCILLKQHYTNKYVNEHVASCSEKLPNAQQVTKDFTVMNYSELFEKGECFTIP